MATLNKWIGIGRIGKMETRFTAGGEGVVNFSLAVNDPYGKKEKGEATDWFNCVAFKKTAEVLEKYAKVGQEIYAEGRIKFKSWEKDGVKQYKTEVIVDNIQLLGGKSDSEPKEHSAEPAIRAPSQSASSNTVGGGFSDFDDEIPFACPRGAALNVI